MKLALIPKLLMPLGVSVAGVFSSFSRQDLKRRLKESERKYQNTVEHAVEGIIQTSREGKFISVNTTFARMLGYDSPAEVMEKITSIDHQIYVEPEVRRDFLRRLEQNRQARCEYRAWRKDGTQTWFMASSRFVTDEQGKFMYYESIVEDVSEIREREEKLRHTTDQLIRSNAELRRFARAVAHDLREPLRTVRAYGQLLTRDFGGKLGRDADDYLKFIVEGGTRMQRFIDDIFEFSLVESTHPRWEKVDLNEVLGEVTQGLDHVIRETQAEVQIGELPMVRGDRNKLIRLFQNLITNALKFRREETPRILITSASDEGGRWTFAVHDNGVGFDQGSSDKVFELFVRLGNSTTDSGLETGLGIGLSMCRRIVEIHGGKIWAESTVGMGSTFFFTLPKTIYHHLSAAPSPETEIETPSLDVVAFIDAFGGNPSNNPKSFPRPR